MNKKIILTLLVLACLTVATNKVKVEQAYAEVSQSEVVLEIESGRILHSVNGDLKRPIASLTKILSAIVVLENTDIKRNFTIPQSCCGVEGSSIYLKPSEVYTIEDLLYGLMLRSGNDCAEALAVATCGSTERFAKKMNERARAIGAVNSNFINPHGLHSDDHYSTATDMAKIFAYGMKNKIFKEIVGCKYREITEITSGEKRVLKNKNKLLFNYDYCTGGKTGYTKRSGRCLAASAEKDGMGLVSIVLGCSPTYEVTEANFNTAYKEFKMTEICAPDKFNRTFDVENGKEKCTGYIKESFSYPLRKGEEKELEIKVNCDKKLQAPIKKDEKIGNMQIFLKNQLIFFQNIYSIKGVEKRFNILEPIENWSVKL